VRLLASVVAKPAGFELEYCPATGQRTRDSLMSIWSLPFERCSPVRSVSSFKGQSNFSGSWWMATTADHVGYESCLERDHLIAFDADPDVVAVASQPFWIHWNDDRRVRRHAPDYFLRLRDGSAVVVDVRADDRIEARDVEACTATERACRSVGWEYRRDGLDSVVPVFLKVRRAGVWRSSCPFLPHAPLEPLSLALGKP
jgi:hypothetical protein